MRHPLRSDHRGHSDKSKGFVERIVKTYNLGIIGAGMYGKILAGWFRKDPRARIRWINSASEATTKAAAAGVRGR